jgi:hypothetical protein
LTRKAIPAKNQKRCTAIPDLFRTPFQKKACATASAAVNMPSADTAWLAINGIADVA